MTVSTLLITLLGIAIVGIVSYWIITKFFAEPVRTVALLVVGVLLLLVLLAQFFPEAGNFRVFR